MLYSSHDALALLLVVDGLQPLFIALNALTIAVEGRKLRKKLLL